MKTEMESLKIPILPESQSSTKPKSKATKSIIFLIIATVVITLGLFTGKHLLCPKPSFRYSIVIDAGSSGTRVHVFGYWFDQSGKPVFDFGEKHYANLKVTPGLSAYANNPEEASVSLKKLVEFAKKRIPKRKVKKSEIRLMATAGLRLLDVKIQEEILWVVRRVLGGSGFLFRDEWASVITGSDEGIYAWVIANYALGSLGSDPLETTGIVELGGASAQVTFVSSENVPPEFSRTIVYGNASYTIYSHSFLHYGKDAALKRLLESLQNLAANSTRDVIIEDPCTPKGYIYDTTSKYYSSGFLADESKLKGSLHAAGNFSKCRSATSALLQEGKENCSYDHCSIGSIFTPHLQGSFLATSNFYYISKFFGLEEKGWLSELIQAGTKYCGEEWSKLKMEYSTEEEEYLRAYCFSSAYIISMLHDSLGIALDDERIKNANEAGEKHIPLDWALGAFILNTVKPTSHYYYKPRKYLGFLGDEAKYKIMKV